MSVEVSVESGRRGAGRRLPGGRKGFAAAAAVVGLAPLVLGACSSSSNKAATSAPQSTGSGSGSSSSSSGAVVKVGAYDFPEGQLLAYLYADGLNKAGIKATVVQIQGRETGEPALTKGDVDVIPEYVSSLLDYFQANSSTSNDATNLKLLQTAAASHNVTVLQPAPATDNYAYGVANSFAQKHNLSTLSQLAAYSQSNPITMAGIQACEDRSYCLAGLKSVYGLKVNNFIVTVLSSQASVDLLTSNKAQLVEFDSSDGILAANPVTILKDDKGLNHSDYVIAAVNSKADTSQVSAELNKIDAGLTQQNLNGANKSVQVDRVPPTEAAKTLLQQVGG